MRVCASLIVLALVLGVAPRAGAAEPAAPNAAMTPDVIKVSIMDGMFRGVPQGLIQAGGQQFGGLFKDLVGLPGDVETEANHIALAKKLDAGKVHLGVFHGFEWAWVKKEYPNLAPLAITVPPHLPQACIVVNAKDAAAGPHALNGASIDVPFNMKAHGIVYVERLERSCPKGAFCVTVSEDLTQDDLLDDLGKNRTKAVLADAAAFASYQKNFPGKAAKVKLLCKSEIFPQTVVVYNKKGLPQKTVDQLQKGLEAAAKSPKGKAFLFMWNLRGFEAPNAAFEDLVVKSLVTFPAPEKK